VSVEKIGDDLKRVSIFLRRYYGLIHGMYLSWPPGRGAVLNHIFDRKGLGAGQVAHEYHENAALLGSLSAYYRLASHG